jgi:carbonic anhydrase/acetyltransferase-like protein (isoleucine patch superfamily)
MAIGRPAVAAGVFVAPAVLIGQVIVEEGASVWFGAVLRGDQGLIHIGRGSSVQDNAVLHVEPDRPTILGENVTIGHAVVLEGCRIEDGAAMGSHAVVLNGAVGRAQAMVAAGSVVGEEMGIPAPIWPAALQPASRRS